MTITVPGSGIPTSYNEWEFKGRQFDEFFSFHNLINIPKLFYSFCGDRVTKNDKNKLQMQTITRRLNNKNNKVFLDVALSK